MSFGLGENGFVKRTLANVRQFVVDAYESYFGASINTQPETPLGQDIDITSERLSLLWEEVEAIFANLNPDYAEGTNLDKVCALIGLVRLPASYSTVTATCTGTNGTVIPAGTQFQVGSDTTNIFETDSLVTIPVGLSIDVECTNIVTGVKVCTAGTLTTIKNPIAGLDSVTNADAGVIGRDLETDAELRVRRLISIAQNGGGTVENIRTNMLELNGVTKCMVFENTTNGVVSGRPAHCFETVVLGGDDEVIAETIWNIKTAGIATHGTTTEYVNDSQGVPRTIKFSRPVDVDMYVIVNITKQTGTLILDDDVKSAVVDYGAGLDIGQDVLPITDIVPAITASVENIRDIDVLVLDSSPPTSNNPFTIDEDELGKFATARITVNVT